ncbi:MAG TPA: lysylphosphatidylglycerol synthase domain-containing protein [Caulobacteraceae bacterium]
MIRRVVTTLAFFAGVTLAVVLALRAGLKPIGHAIAAVGWTGLFQVCALQLVSVFLCAAAWWAVTDRTLFRACFFSRWIRDGATTLVGPAIGEGISARALAVLGGGSGETAAAVTIVDVAVEALSQAAYTLIAFALLFHHLGAAQTLKWTLIVAASLLPVLLMVAVSVSPRALAAGQRLGEKVARLFGVDPGAGFDLARAVEGVYRKPGKIAAAMLLHLVAWTTGAAQVWLIGRAVGAPITLSEGVALHGLVCAARSAAFLVPWAAGVQEGGFLLVGAVLHLSPATAIAMSLVLRGRDVVLGAPAILLWYAAEARRGLARRAEVER